MVRACVHLLGLAALACSVRFDAGAGFRCDDGVSCPAGQQCVGGHCVDPDDGSAAGPDGPTADAPVGMDPPWWDGAFGLRRPILVTNVAAVALPAGYELRLYQDFTPLAPSPFDPLRIVRWDGSGWTEKDRYLDDFADQEQLEEQFFFDLDQELAAGGTNHAYWLYYDNPQASEAPAAPEAVFPIFYEGFGDGVDPGRWAALGTPTSVSGALVLEPGAGVRSIATWGPGYALDVKDSRETAAASSWLGFQRNGDFNDEPPWILWIDWDGAGALAPDSHIPAIGDAASTTGPSASPGTEVRVYTIERHADRLVYGFEGIGRDERVLPAAYQDPLQIRLHNGSAAATVELHSLRVRRVVYPEPQVVLGEPEARP